MTTRSKSKSTKAQAQAQANDRGHDRDQQGDAAKTIISSDQEEQQEEQEPQSQSMWALPSQTTTTQQQHRLQFAQALVPRASASSKDKDKDKAIPASDLVKRLKTLNDALKDLPQEATDTASCDRVARDLVHPSVLHHRDRGVKILVACCLAEILRLYAPEAPYDDAQLKDIFDLFAGQFQHLNQLDNNPYHAFYLQLLASLVLVRSICIVADLDTAEDLTLLFFSHLLTKLQPAHPPHVHRHAADLLIALIEESVSIPQEAVDLLLDAASTDTTDTGLDTTPDPTTSAPAATLAPAQKLALTVIREAGHLLHKPVAQSFMDTLLTAAKAVHQRTASATAALAASHAAHTRMAALYAHAPRMLLNVIPQLEEELVAEHAPFRELALRALATMLKLPAPLAPPLAREYPSAWRAWCGRAVDKQASLRLLWLALVPDVYNAHAHVDAVAAELNAALIKLLLDPDEKVRGAACTLFGAGRLDFDVVRKSATPGVWDALGSRIRDKRASVRLAAVKAAAYVWRRVMHVVLPAKAVPPATDTQAAAAAAAHGHATADSQRIEPPTQSYQVHHTNLDAVEVVNLMATFAWCPRDLLGSAYLNDPELTAILENLLIESVVHPKEPGQSKAAAASASEWELATDRLLWFLSPVLDDDHAKKAFVAVLKRQAVTATETCALLDLAQQHADLAGTQNKAAAADLQLRVARLVQAMAARLPDAPRAEQALSTFIKAYDPAWGHALKSLSQWSERDFVSVKRTAKDVLRTMEAAMPGSMQVLGIVARRISPFIVSHEMVPGLLTRITVPVTPANNNNDEDEGGWAVRLRATAMWVLDVLARTFPGVVAKYAGTALGALDHVPDRAALLHVLAHVECTDLTPRHLQRLVVLAHDAPALAPAVGAVLARGNHVGACEELVRDAATEIVDQDANAERAAGALGMLAKVVKHQVHTYEDVPQGVDRVTARTVWWLMRAYAPVDGAWDARAWVDAADRPAETRAQVAAIKLVTNRVVALARGSSTHELARQALVPLVALLDKVLATGGSLDLPDLPDFAASALRLVAGRAVLKLARTPVVADRIPEHVYLRTAILIEDPVQQVRASMLAKVRQLLALMQVSARWVPLVALAANDPDDLTKQSASALLKGMAHNPTLARGVELALPRLVHVVAHLVPPGSIAESVQTSATASAAAAAIKAVAAPIEMFLDAVMRAESVATLFHVLVKIKEHKAKHPVALHSAPDMTAEKHSTESLAAGVNTNEYVLAEYATKYLRDRCKLHGWPIATVPKTLDLPRDLYVALDRAEALANTKQTYLTPSITASALAASAATGSAARKGAVKRTRKAKGDADEDDVDEVESGDEAAPTTPAKAKKPARPVRPTSKSSKRRKTSTSDEDENGGPGNDDAESPNERRKSGRVQQKLPKSYHEVDSDAEEDHMDVDHSGSPAARRRSTKNSSPRAKNGRKSPSKEAEESASDTE